MDKIISIINEAESVAIIPHVKADGDAIGSCLAMREALLNLGKRARIYSEEPVEKRLEFLDEDIAEVYTGEKTECDTAIVLDCGDLGRVSSRCPILEDAKHIINIDHHRTNTGFAEASLVETTASATAEVLYKLFKRMELPLTKRLAKFLYAGICSDTGCFAYSNVSPDTFRIAAELIETGINHAEITRLMFDCVDLKSEKMKASLTESIHSYYDGKLNIVSVTEKDTEKYGIKPEDVIDMVNLPRRIRGTEIAVGIKQYDGKIRVSLRSNNDADVAEVAMKFNGGGHTKAAGCTMDCETVEEAEELLVKACGEVL